MVVLQTAETERSEVDLVPETRDGLLTPGALVRGLRRRVLLVIVCVIGMLAMALGWSLHEQKQYQATAQLLFRDPGFDQKLFGSSVFQAAVDPDRQAATNVLLISNRRVGERTADTLGPPWTPAEIARRLDVSVEAETDVISVRMTDSDPQRAARLANTYSQEFIKFRRAADRAKVTETRTLLDRQVDALTPAQSQTAEGKALRSQADQLKVLASLQTGNAELVQAAVAPTAPSSPRTVRNAAAGALVGLLIGLGLAFLLERLDRRLRDAGEIEETFGRPILGTVPESRAFDRTGRTLTGVSGWAEGEAFGMIRANLRYFNVGHPTRSVLITSAAPGEGKTTVAWNLAAAAAAAGDHVLLIEADLRHPSKLESVGMPSGPGLSALIAGNASIGDVLRQLPVPSMRASVQHERHMDVIPTGAIPPNPTDLLESETMGLLIQDSEKRYDLVIIDTPPTSVVSDAIPLIKRVSGVLVVTRLGKSTRASLQQLRRQLDNLDAPTLGVVVNSMQSVGYGYGYGYGQEPAATSTAVGTGNSATPAAPDAHEPEPVASRTSR